jgi:hypothetical protein
MTTQTDYSGFFYKKDEAPFTAIVGAGGAEGEAAELQQKYKHSQDIFSSVELDFKIFEGIQGDLAYKFASPEVQALIGQHHRKSAELLMFNAAASENSFEEDKYNKVLQKNKVKTLEKAAPEIGPQVQVSDNEANDDFITKIKKFFIGLFVSLSAFFLFYERALLDNIGLLNIYRLSYVFSKNTWLYIWYYLRDLGLLVNNTLKGIYLNVQALEFTTNIFYLLSVLLFVPRLIIDLCSIVKHAAFPSTAERVYTSTELAWIEFKRRYKRLGNDLVWIVINALTNFPQYFNIPIPTANWLLAGFFFFDVIFLSIILRIEMNKFNEKIQWIDEQLQLADQEESESQNMESLREQKDTYKKMFTLMKNQANSMLAGTKATFGLYIAATLLFFVSFSLILTLGLQLALPIGFFSCVLVVGLILSGGSFGEAIQARAIKNIELEQGLSKELQQDGRKQAERDAWINFGLKLAENIIVPMFIFGLVAIHWPTAIVVAVAYIAVKLYLSNKKDEPEVREEKISDVNILASANDCEIKLVAFK